MLTRKKPLQSTTELKPRRTPRKARQDQVAPRHRKPALPKRARTRIKHRPPHTAAERAHLDRVAKLGCICCAAEGRRSDADLHHIREGYGEGQRASHWEVLPLCEGHHQGMRHPVDKSRLAFHRARKTWVLRFGRESDLLRQVWDRLGLDFDELPARRGSEPPWWGHQQPEQIIPEDARRILLLPQEPE